MTFSEVQKILNRIRYKPNFMLCLQEHSPEVWMMWTAFETIDATDGKPISLESRIWFMTPHFSEEDIIHTAFLCFKQMEEHEMMEFFKVDGISIFNPHITIDAHKQAFRASFLPEMAIDPSPVPA